MTTSTEFELFELFHIKLKEFIDKIIEINARKSISIVSKCQPLYAIVKERVFLDDFWIDYKNWLDKISSLKTKVLKNAGFLYFNMKERNGRITARVWSKEGLTFFQLSPLDIKDDCNKWHRLLITYMLCALADLVSFRGKQTTNRLPNLPKHPNQRKLLNNNRNANIYRPRAKQESQSNEDKVEPYTKRNPFFVAWHLRKIMKGNTASAEARNKAIEYANLPWDAWDTEWKGFTFVSPHVRGGNKVNNHDIKKLIVNRLAESFSLTIDNLYK
ncbi:hypothetical protein L9W92_09425 [Pelotomaculum terephthalicicum JT]|uniref:hypothetical protein n=1 Tax=Pelotomaculum TaxID=191373 RepID=UPI0009D11DBD|nr:MULTISPECIES: hypothetical protein [Pelotomaculum]MCG9968271.1 hypothetical protein [Pelotomaculum terephthalicicum JT]OPX87284.1 MAG: hypothetical protein A4E54_01742 [Pelotomaculum sp. PtaB.Bin117]OPY61348.1 MAG: hypothetical protein A4E56_02133 [Pelotomaculum sp. PtaU1.Bin065]